MRISNAIAVSLLLLSAGTAVAVAPPVAPERPVVETHFGTRSTDPYRYFEDVKQPEVMAYLKAEAAYAEGRAVLVARASENVRAREGAVARQRRCARGPHRASGWRALLSAPRHRRQSIQTLLARGSAGTRAASRWIRRKRSPVTWHPACYQLFCALLGRKIRRLRHVGRWFRACASLCHGGRDRQARRHTHLTRGRRRTHFCHLHR